MSYIGAAPTDSAYPSNRYTRQAVDKLIVFFVFAC